MNHSTTKYRYVMYLLLKGEFSSVLDAYFGKEKKEEEEKGNYLDKNCWGFE